MSKRRMVHLGSFWRKNNLTKTFKRCHSFKAYGEILEIQIWIKKRTESRVVGMTTWVRVERASLDVDLNDEDDQVNPEPSESNGMVLDNSSRIRELEDEVRQKDTVMTMKTEEIRRLTIQNREYELRVHNSSFALYLVGETRRRSGGAEEGWQGNTTSGKPAVEGWK